VPPADELFPVTSFYSPPVDHPDHEIMLRSWPGR